MQDLFAHRSSNRDCGVRRGIFHCLLRILLEELVRIERAALHFALKTHAKPIYSVSWEASCQTVECVEHPLSPLCDWIGIFE